MVTLNLRMLMWGGVGGTTFLLRQGAFLVLIYKWHSPSPLTDISVEQMASTLNAFLTAERELHRKQKMDEEIASFIHPCGQFLVIISGIAWLQEHQWTCSKTLSVLIQLPIMKTFWRWIRKPGWARFSLDILELQQVATGSNNRATIRNKTFSFDIWTSKGIIQSAEVIQ